MKKFALIATTLLVLFTFTAGQRIAVANPDGGEKILFDQTVIYQLPDLNFSMPFDYVFNSMSEIQGRWVSDSYMVNSGREAWIIDFERIGDQIRIMVKSGSGIMDPSIPFPTTQGDLIDVTENNIKFSFLRKKVYTPNDGAYSTKRQSASNAWGVVGGAVGGLLGGFLSTAGNASSQSEIDKKQAADIGKTTYYYYGFDLNLEGNMLKGYLTTVITEEDANGVLKEISNDAVKYTLNRVPDSYPGANNAKAVDALLKIKHGQFVSLCKSTAKRKKDNSGMIDMGVLYLNGLGVKSSRERALNCFMSVVKKGDPEAMNNIAMLYATAPVNGRGVLGRGILKDSVKVFEWYEKATKQDNTHAMVELGRMYLFGISVEKNFDKARELFDYAIELGEKEAYVPMAYMCLNGLGMEQDIEQAVEFYRRGVQKGSARAMYNLGLMYGNGRGVSQDKNRALELYYESAQLGFTPAMDMIANMYRNGDVLPYNYIEGKKWDFISKLITLNSPTGRYTLNISAMDLISLDGQNVINMGDGQVVKLSTMSR